MSHPDFVRPSGQWPQELVPCAADYQRWDVAQFKAINGDDGGLWSPTKPIVLGGSGLALTSPSTVIVGGVTTTTGGSLVCGTPAGDFPQLSPARARTVEVPILGTNVHVDLGVIAGDQFEERYLGRAVGPGTGTIGVQLISVTGSLLLELPPRYLHQGARFGAIAVQFAVTAKQAIPATPISLAMRVLDAANVAHPITPASPPVWQSLHTFPLGSYVIPAHTATQNGYYFKATSVSGTGTSGGAEPAWPSVVGSAVVDNAGANQITWTCIGRSGHYATAGATPDSYFNNGDPQTLAFDADQAAPSLVDITSNRYSVTLSRVDPAILVTGMTLSFDSITSLAFQ